MSAPPPRQPGADAPTPVPAGRGQNLFRARRRLARHTPGPPGTAGIPGTANTPARGGTAQTKRAGRYGLRLTHRTPPGIQSPPRPTPLQGSADPRWVLAVRTAELLQSDILTPERRERIVRMGKMFNLTAFDANMIIAIVQDQARRGIAPHLCPAAGEPQLRMITPPRQRSFLQLIQSRYGLTAAALLGAMLATEALLLWWLF